MWRIEHSLRRFPVELIATFTALALAHTPARAASFESDAASLDWDDPAAWTGAGGFPAAGDNVIIHHDRQFDGNEAFGSSVSNSFWSTAATRLQLYNHRIIHTNNSTLHLTAGNTWIGCLSNPKGWRFINTAGSTFSHDVAANLMITCGGGAGVAEQGGFINRGTYRFTEAGTLTLARGAWFKNHGTIRNDSHGSVSILNSVAEIAAFSNDTGAVVSSLGSNSVLLVRLQNIMDAGGTWLAMTNAEIRLDPVTVLAMSPNTVFQGDTASTGIVDIAGDWSINMTGVASGIVTFAQHNELRIVTNISLDLDASGASGGTTEGAVPGSVMWGGSGLGIDIEDSTLTLNTPVSLSGANAVLRSSGAPKSGILVNAVGNTFTHALAGSLTIRCADSGTVGVGFENRGTFVFATMNASVAAISHANVFRNVEGAAIRANAGSGNTAIFTGSGQLSNQGSLEVLSGTLDVASTIHYPQFESGALTGGVLDVNGTLDLNRGANIITIGTNAVVRLRGADTTFPELMGNLTTVNGTFGLHSGMVYNATGDLVVPGTIEFGLSDSDQSDVVVKTGISNAVNVTLTGGKVSVVDLGLSTPGTFTLIEFTGTRTGFLSMGAVPPNGLGYKLRHLDKMVQLSVSGGGGVILLFF